MRFVLFRRSDMWRWRLVVRNGRAVAESGQGYHNRRDCLASVAMVVATTAQTPIEDEDGELFASAARSEDGVKTGSGN